MEISMTRLTTVIAAALIIPLFLAVILVKLLLDLYAEEPDSSESRQLDRRQDLKQRNAGGSRRIQQITVAFDGGADIRVPDRAGH
jgi:hypothetical protein